jgi:hypothetical protein
MEDLLPALVTTIGALIGSFGGYSLAASSQRRAADRQDTRALRDAASARAIALEDERHAFQLDTLLALQELTRRMTRSTLLIIHQDIATIKEYGGYRMLPKEDPDDFAKSIEFSHQVARVTHEELRGQLESFSGMCAEYSIPPFNWAELAKDDALAIQNRRWVVLMERASETSADLGEHLRREIDRKWQSFPQDPDTSMSRPG